MKKSKIFNFKANWASGKFSLWKISLVLCPLIILSPWIRLWSSEFTLESHLSNPERSLYVYVNHGIFTFVSNLADGSSRKSSGIVGFTNNAFYFLTLSSEYLHTGDQLTPDLKRDFINVNNHFFDARLEKLTENKVLITYDEELKFEGTQTQLADINGNYPEID
ncbi:hypothetical protein [Vibrio crassostreae]|uniref:hypothetical protein n=1 Tax=Vibrio crassostreae TaxID=246167 RepID=UPI000FC1D77E|nr:hypothetical protein [Vibrio crassostreae]ROR24217.1 hypothetical protein EDB67_105227 [Vibrio crassostreae]TCV24946.1 hypothetical protein EDB71_11032 [Vibrio crassostreae]